jgi:AAA15 family ATPase/GTPase
MIKKISFVNYKIFKREQTLEFKPLTIIIGKNSSGKSAILKLMSIIKESLNGEHREPIVTFNNLDAGGEFRDLIYGRKLSQLKINMESDQDNLSIVIGANPHGGSFITSWSLNGRELDNLDNQKFMGFKPESASLGADLESFVFDTNYISSHRHEPKRYFDRNLKLNHIVGMKGENVYSILIDDSLNNSKNVLKKTSEFYKDNFEGWGIFVNADNAPPYRIELEKEDLRVNFKDVGLGMIYALPLVVSALLPYDKETLTIIEEPELHLHPAAHGNLAQLFAESIKDGNKHYLIETHSPNFVLRLRRLVAEEKINSNDVVIYYVDSDDAKLESMLKRINIDNFGKPRDENGEIYWPENVFSETLDETSAIRTAQLNKK